MKIEKKILRNIQHSNSVITTSADEMPRTLEFLMTVKTDGKKMSLSYVFNFSPQF